MSVWLLLLSCGTSRELQLPSRSPGAMSGNEYYKRADTMNRVRREALAMTAILSGNIPDFLRKLVPVEVAVADSSGRNITAVFYVTPDYLSIGSSEDFARVPLTPMTGQLIADSLGCFLPSRKMVDDIYRHAAVRLAPVPLYAFRDSAIIFWHHHLIIEGQRKGRKGLIAGIKKDVVISSKTDARNVVIYGWHKPDGKPIQPLYGKHVNWYVDYSHGIRLVYRKIKVNGQWIDYTAVLAHPVYRRLLSDEDSSVIPRYPTTIITLP